jgi:hypothetical protein
MTRSLRTEPVQCQVSLRGDIARCDREYGERDGGNGANEQRPPIDGSDGRIWFLDKP